MSATRRPDHEWLLTAPVYGSEVRMEAAEVEAGVLKGVALVMQGEARGHGIFLDEEFVDDVIEHGNRKSSGLKVRFGHPNMSGTALGTFLGRAKYLRRDDVGEKAVARADLFLSRSAEDTPHGNLRAYVLGLADEDPDAFGMSLVLEQGPSYRRTPEGKKVRRGDDGYLDAPPKDFATLKKLQAADMVDDPAATDGIFASPWARETFAGQMTEFLDTHPEIFDLVAENPEVIEGFMARYKAYKARKEGVMPDKPEKADDQTVVEPDETEVETDTADAVEAETEEEETAETVESESEQLDARAECKRFVEAFGAIHGAEWFAEGKSFDEALLLHVDALKGIIDERNAMIDEQAEAHKAAVADLEQKLAAARKATGLSEDQVIPPDDDEVDRELTEAERKAKVLLDEGLETDEAKALERARRAIADRDKRKSKS